MLVRFPARELAAQPPAHEDAVHRLNDGRRRAISLIEFLRVVSVFVCLFATEYPNIAVTPTVDRLLPVADDKDRLFAVRCLRLFDERRERGPLFAARVLKFIESPCADLRVEAVFECEANIVWQRRDKARYVVEDEKPLPAHLGVVVLLVFRYKAVDTAGKLKPTAHDKTADANDCSTHGSRLGTAEGIRLSVERHVDCRAREEAVHLEELFCKPLESVEIATEIPHPFNELGPRA